MHHLRADAGTRLSIISMLLRPGEAGTEEDRRYAGSDIQPLIPFDADRLQHYRSVGAPHQNGGAGADPDRCAS
jgi:hypothetical protein